MFKAFLPLKLGWASQVTINFARDPQLMRLARECGCYGVFIGFETFSNKSIRDAGKGVNRPRRIFARHSPHPRGRNQSVGVVHLRL